MKGRRGAMRDLFQGHGLFALAAIHAARKHVGDSPQPTEITGYVLAMLPAMVPLAILLDWFAVKVAWISDFVILRILFTIPGLVCTVMAVISLIAWLWVIAWITVYVIAYVHAWYKHKRSQGSP